MHLEGFQRGPGGGGREVFLLVLTILSFLFVYLFVVVCSFAAHLANNIFASFQSTSSTSKPACELLTPLWLLFA